MRRLLAHYKCTQTKAQMKKVPRFDNIVLTFGRAWMAKIQEGKCFKIFIRALKNKRVAK